MTMHEGHEEEVKAQFEAMGKEHGADGLFNHKLVQGEHAHKKRKGFPSKIFHQRYRHIITDDSILAETATLSARERVKRHVAACNQQSAARGNAAWNQSRKATTSKKASS